MSMGTSVPIGTAAAAASLMGKIMFPVVAACLGATLIAMATGDLAPLAGVWPLMVVALLLSWAIGLGRLNETSAGLAMFGVCLLVAGVSHVYQHAVFGSVLTSSPEVFFWYDLSKDGFAYELPSVNAPYAVNAWRAAYELAAAVGLGDGVWIAIAINALLMAASATLIAQTASILFAHDRRRVRLVVALTLLCPTFWMFGGMLVRDSFALLIQAAAILVVVHLLARGVTIWRLLTHLAVLALLIQATIGVRTEMIYTFPITAAVAAVAVSLQGRGLRRPARSVAAVLVAGGVTLAFLDRFMGTISIAQEGYLNILTNYDFASSGLGNRLVVSQPLPIRVVTGTLYMHVFPIPVWFGFDFSNWEYHWLKSFAAIFVIGVTPLAALGFWRAVSASLQGKRGTAPLFFIALYWPLMAAAVAVTSLETRHLGQFMPAFVLLAAIPDMKQPSDRRPFQRLGLGWYGAVAAGHVLWLFVS